MNKIFPAECPVVAQCGGCPGLLLQRDEYILNRNKIHEEALSVFAGNTPLKWDSSSPKGRYRRRIRLRVNEGIVTFFNKNKSRECIVLTESLLSLVNELMERSAKAPEVFADATHLDVRAADVDGLRAVSIYGRRRVDPSVHFESMNDTLWFDERQDVVPNQKWLTGKGHQHSVPLNAFLQINEEINAKIVRDLFDFAQGANVQSLWDSFCGVGNLSLDLLLEGVEGGGDELNSVAVNAANETLSWQRIAPRYFVADATQNTDALSRCWDLVICNPPRAGLRAGVKRLISNPARYIAYLSCNPKTLSTDASQLLKSGYRPLSVKAYEMFPFTGHIETLVIFENTMQRP